MKQKVVDITSETPNGVQQIIDRNPDWRVVTNGEAFRSFFLVFEARTANAREFI